MLQITHTKQITFNRSLIKPTLCSIVFSICVITSLKAQPVNIEWQQILGGTNSEGAYDIASTSDGGYILGGYTYSGISGNKTVASFGGSDYWVTKTDALGVIEWQKEFGGSDFDQLESITQTADGGYILGGYTASGISGNKTEGNIAGSLDLWFIKLDASGNIVWQNNIGGSGGDYIGEINPTSDGGYIVSATSYSGISGDKTENSIGAGDYWIIKLNASGNIVWQNTIGGTSADYCYRAKETSDGNFIVSGSSNSPISFDKTEGTIEGVGTMDIWVLKLNASGNIVWQNTIGGTATETAFEMDVTPDGGAVIATQSYSNSSADKAENNVSGGTTSSDYWVIKLDTDGNITWENTLGGTGEDYNHALITMSNGDIAVGGFSNSGIGGDKTEAAKGAYDFWMVKLDASGNVLYDKTIGGNQYDYNYCMTESADNKIVLAGTSASNISGDKTTNSYGINDFWMVKIDDLCEPSAEICNALDDDCDGLIDDDITVEISVVAGGPTTFCQGNSVILTATHTGTTLQWKKNGSNIPGATGPTYTVNQKGTYACVATSDCGTATSDNIVVTVNKNPTATIAAGGPTSFCAGGSVTFTETPSGGCTYQWYKGANPIAGATSLSYVATTAGNYKCRVTKVATGCFKNSNSIAVFITCKEDESSQTTDDSNALFDLIIYPNPAEQVLYVQLQSDDDYVEEFIITDITGNVVKQFYLNDNETMLNIATLPAGMYLIQSNSESGLLVNKFIKL